MVTYADLNLKNEDGVARLFSRVKAAVRDVCEPRDYTKLSELRPTLACRRHSMERAKADIATAVDKATRERSAARASLQVAMLN